MSFAVMLKNVLIDDDLAQHTNIGKLVVHKVLKVVEIKGYDTYFGHGRKDLLIQI